MAHQQKLISIVDINNVAAAGAGVVLHNLHLSADCEPALAVAPIKFACIPSGADPSGTFRWWITNVTTANYTANWAGCTNLGGVSLRFIAQMYHSICYDYNYTERPY